MRGKFSASAEITRRGNYAPTEMMVPQAIYDDTRQQRTRSMFNVRQPIGKGNSGLFRLLQPLGGIGLRFKELGYMLPKPLIHVMGKPILYWLLDNLNFVLLN